MKINRKLVVFQGCARFAEILQNCVSHQVFGKTCSIGFLGFTLKLPIRTSLSVTPTHSFFCYAQFQQNKHISCNQTLNDEKFTVPVDLRLNYP